VDVFSIAQLMFFIIPNIRM